MNITLTRLYRKPTYTIGRLTINGTYVCDTLEPADRGLDSKMSLPRLQQLKIPGTTAIPTGRYRLTLSVISPRFATQTVYRKIGGRLPRLMNVPAFAGILMHIGNYPHETKGCILLGENTVRGAVMNSRRAFDALYKMLDASNEELWITIK